MGKFWGKVQDSRIRKGSPEGDREGVQKVAGIGPKDVQKGGPEGESGRGSRWGVPNGDPKRCPEGVPKWVRKGVLEEFPKGGGSKRRVENLSIWRPVLICPRRFGWESRLCPDLSRNGDQAFLGVCPDLSRFRRK